MGETFFRSFFFYKEGEETTLSPAKHSSFEEEEFVTCLLEVLFFLFTTKY